MNNEPTKMPVSSNESNEAKKDREITINLKDINGDVVPLSINENETIQALIDKFKNLKGLSHGASILIYKDGRKASEKLTIQSLNIQHEDTLNYTIRLPGGRSNCQ